MSDYDDIIYKSIEKLAIIEIDKLKTLVEKRKNTTTRISSLYYDKKILKVRNKCLKYIFQLHKIDPDKTNKAVNGAFKETMEQQAES